MSNFKNWKANAIKKLDQALDRSRAGGVDKPVRHLVDLINEQENLYTTSSCSGRIIIFSNIDTNAPGKGHCTWHLSSHEIISYQELLDTIVRMNGSESDYSKNKFRNQEFSIKFEPCIFHVMVENLDLARIFMETARSAGFRNSGITMGMPAQPTAQSNENGKRPKNKNKPTKINVALRHTLGLEVPIKCPQFLLDNEDYLKFLHGQLNEKMIQNLENIEKLEKALKNILIS